MRRSASFVLATLSLLIGAAAIRAETPGVSELDAQTCEWIRLGARMHVGFGSFIPAGIRIGFDALQRLDAKPREVTVVYYDSDKAPCACIADGISIVTNATVGQRTLSIGSEKAPVGAIAVIIIRKKGTKEALKYTVSESWLPKLAEHYEQIMKADNLFSVEPFTEQ